MSKRTKTEEGRARLLDAWMPPRDAGEPIGCVATTFTFSAEFFEGECLARFLRLQSDPDEDGPAYLCEREERLAALSCVAVLVDGHHAQGRRNLRWDLLTARMRGGILHAKLSLLRWSHLIRLIVASANLTTDGYRRNREVFGILDFHANAETPLACLQETVVFLSEVARTAAPSEEEVTPTLTRWQTFLDSTLAAASNWGKTIKTTGSAPRIYTIFTGPGRKSVFDQIQEHWPTTPPAYADVVSPFFDSPGAQNLPAKRIWDILRQRGKAYVTYQVEAVDLLENKGVFLRIPKEVKYTPRDSCSVGFERLAPPLDGAGTDATERPLHMKIIWFDNRSENDWVGYLMGSSNFTSAGMGLKEIPNLEANLLYVTQDRDIYRRMIQSWPATQEVGGNLSFLDEPISNDDEPNDALEVLPEAFGTAIYRVAASEAAEIELSFPAQPPDGWRILTEEDSNFYDEAAWMTDGGQGKKILPWTSSMPPSGFWVSWSGCGARAWWPVNIEHGSSLPPPDLLRNMPLTLLIEILSSAQPLHEIMRKWLRRQRKDGHQTERYPFDPHKNVDTSAFLLQRTRRISWALSGLRERLSRLHVSNEALEWRLRGPVGVIAVRDAILREAMSTSEKTFLLAELALELSRTKVHSQPGYLPQKVIKGEIRRLIQEIQASMAPYSAELEPTIRSYVEAAFVEAGR